MRSPNHLQIKQWCRDTIAPIMTKFGLGPTRKIAIDESGWVNPCFFVNDQYVFRFNARDPGFPKFQREKLVFDLLKSSMVPVPSWVTLDDSREISPFDVLISQMLLRIQSALGSKYIR